MNNVKNILSSILIIVLIVSLTDYFGFIIGFIATFFIILIYLVMFLLIKNIKLDKIRNQLDYSKINELKEGLVKVKGEALYIEPIYSTLKEKKCIGYYHKVEKLKRNMSGFRPRYVTLSNQFICNPFILKDETGEVNISNENITVLALSKSKVKFRQGKKHTEELFKNNTMVEIIGRFSKNKIIKDDKKNIFIVIKVKD
ncbi:MAG: hypothetical protein ABJD66_14660 [Cellulophaga sp.]|uniref:hypothetical protein n=1 Tax=Cellulophaga sp. TaxID=1972202 RepID=UPI00326442DC